MLGNQRFFLVLKTINLHGHSSIVVKPLVALHAHPDSSLWQLCMSQYRCSYCKLEYLWGYAAATVTRTIYVCSSCSVPSKMMSLEYCSFDLVSNINTSGQILDAPFFAAGGTQYKRLYGDVPPTWVAKSASWYINDPLFCAKCGLWIGPFFKFF